MTFVREPLNGVGLLMAISFAGVVVVIFGGIGGFVGFGGIGSFGGFGGIGKSTTMMLGPGVVSGKKNGLGSGVPTLEKTGGLGSASGSVLILSLVKAVSRSGDGVGPYIGLKIASGSMPNRLSYIGSSVGSSVRWLSVPGNVPGIGSCSSVISWSVSSID